MYTPAHTMEEEKKKKNQPCNNEKCINYFLTGYKNNEKQENKQSIAGIT